ncbi:Uncharacterized protein BM_BM17892 [Brugia malayi]|uniref:Ovule protein n=1 Tax=Brugia malayi TaxID=6279 RepID=A0A4E9ERT4_BRUMA|nr:Uncharacterized protein BM_BM17892 [Brugia malayi]VIO85996.1 Uncharacterized protein BM_BM17892 [Brugia malayi]
MMKFIIHVYFENSKNSKRIFGDLRLQFIKPYQLCIIIELDVRLYYLILFDYKIHPSAIAYQSYISSIDI